MSRQNKVNPGMYTQRGRLAQDDIARELARQRATASPEPWPEPHHPLSREALNEEKEDGPDAKEDREPAEPVKKKPARAKAKRAAGKAKKVTAAKRASSTAGRSRDRKRQTGRRGRPGIK